MDEATRAVMERLASVFPQVETMSGTEARAAVRAMPRPPVSPPAVAGVEDRRADGVPVRVYRPIEGTQSALVYFHGGGFVLGDVESSDPSARVLCNATGAVTVSVDYRLAPEHPFPTAVEDAATAVRWTFENANELGIDRRRIGVAGDSAGGNLAAVAAQVARDDGLALALQLLVYPMLDPACAGMSHTENAEGYFLSEDAVRWFWSQYLGERDLQSDARVAPARAADLSGLAPATIVTASHDPLRDDGEAYAHALSAAGVPVDLRRAEGMFHGFFGMAAALPAAAAFRDKVYASVGAALRG
jgi:acetyl esterase